MVNVLILLKLEYYKILSNKIFENNFQDMFYTSTFKFSFYFSLKINSFRCLCLGPLLDFIHNKSKLYYGFTQSLGLRLSP